MKKMILSTVAVAVCLFLLAAFLKDSIFDIPQRCQVVAASVTGNEGERAAAFANSAYAMTYKINYLSLIPIGTLKISKREEEEGPVYSMEASTSDSFADFFVHATARLESFFDKTTNLPFRYSETTQVKGALKTKDIEFDRLSSIAVRGDRKIKISENTYDPIGAFVTALNFPYKNNQEHLLQLLSKDSLYLLKAKRVASSRGFFEVAIHIAREDLSSSHGATLKVWLTDDAARIPLVLKSWTPVGYASVVLEKIEVHERP